LAFGEDDGSFPFDGIVREGRAVRDLAQPCECEVERARLVIEQIEAVGGRVELRSGVLVPAEFDASVGELRFETGFVGILPAAERHVLHEMGRSAFTTFFIESTDLKRQSKRQGAGRRRVVHHGIAQPIRQDAETNGRIGKDCGR